MAPSNSRQLVSNAIICKSDTFASVNDDCADTQKTAFFIGISLVSNSIFIKSEAIFERSVTSVLQHYSIKPSTNSIRSPYRHDTKGCELWNGILLLVLAKVRRQSGKNLVIHMTQCVAFLVPFH